MTKKVIRILGIRRATVHHIGISFFPLPATNAPRSKNSGLVYGVWRSCSTSLWNNK